MEGSISLGSIPSFHGAGPSFSKALTPAPSHNPAAGNGFVLADPTLLGEQIAALAFAMGILIFAAAVYRSHGVRMQLILVAYITSLFSTQLAVKAAVTRFPFPMFLTALHFASTWLTSIIYYGSGYSQRQDLLTHAVAGTGRSKWVVYLSQLTPPAVTLCGSVMLANAALMYIGASLNAIIGIATPLATACLAAACGSRIVCVAWIGIAVAACGDAVAAFNGFRAALALPGSKDANATAVALGITLSCGSMLLRSLKAVLQGRLMERGLGYPKESGERPVPKLDAMQLISLQSPVLTVVAVMLMVCVEGLRGLRALRTISPVAAALVVLSCFCATSMNFAGMCAIRLLGAPASQLAGKLNVFVTAALSAGFLGDVLTPGEVFGGVVTLVGLAIYEKAQKRAYKKVETEERQESCAHAGAVAMRLSLPPEATNRVAASPLGHPATPCTRGFASPTAVVVSAIRSQIAMSKRRHLTVAGIAECVMHEV